MAEATSKGKNEGTVSPATDPMAAARAARKAGGSRTANLGESQKFALRSVQGAKKACTILAQSIQSGSLPSPEALQACAVLQGQVGSDLFR